MYGLVAAQNFSFGEVEIFRTKNGISKLLFLDRK